MHLPQAQPIEVTQPKYMLLNSFFYLSKTLKSTK